MGDGFELLGSEVFGHGHSAQGRTLWALHHSGFEVWFKGGTSLSKGFSLIERFSEDLDLKIEPGCVPGVPVVSN